MLPTTEATTMHHIENIGSKTIGKWSISLDIIDFCAGCSWLDELYTLTDEHQAGTTVAIPYHRLPYSRHGGYKYAIPQMLPSELASEFAKQGHDNPSRSAYELLQKELSHYMQASDCVIRCEISCAGTILARTYSTSFDYSCELEDSAEDLARSILKEYGRDFIHEAMSDARDQLSNMAA